MVTYTYRNGGWTEDLFYFIDTPSLIAGISGSPTQATISDGLFYDMIVTGTGLGWSGTTPNAGTVNSLEARIDGVSRVTVTDIALPFNAFTIGGYRSALEVLGAVHTDAAGDVSASFMAGGTGSDSFYSLAGNDTLSGDGADDNFFVTERISGIGSSLDIRGGTGEDTVYVVNRAVSGDVFLNLSTSTLSSIERVNILAGGRLVLAASQGAGLALDVAATGGMTVLQTSGVALNLNTLFTSLTRGSGTIWLGLEGTGVGDRQIGATGFNNSFYGRAGDDSITGADLQDELYGDLGNDSLVGNGGSDGLYGGLGFDTLVGNAGSDALYGGQGNDVYRIDADDTVIELAGEGIDWVHGAMSLVLANYAHVENAGLLGSGAFNITGTGVANELLGNGAANVLSGFGGSDSLTGGGGNDRLFGGGGVDLFFAGDGDDRLEGGDGSDAMNADAGNDSVFGGAGEDSVMGGLGNDLIYGGADYDGLYGGGDNDRLFGDAGNDQLYGDSGNDTLSGGAGNDFLNGGLDRDTFVFSTGGGRDQIFGYVTSGPEADRIDLRALVAIISYADLTLNHMSQVGFDVHITAGSDVLIVVNRTLAQFDATDFLI